MSAAINLRQLFLRHVGQTSDAPLALEIVKAKGMELEDAAGKKYLDLIAGISVCNVGHCHPKVVKAIRRQAGLYQHVMVYGELVQSPQVMYAKLLTSRLPASLNCVYFTNSGAEATEAAMKLVKRATGRTHIIAFNQSYHGSTQGALSLLGDEYWRNAFRPLLPAVIHADYNDFGMLEQIDRHTAAVFVEAVQAERGVVAAQKKWLTALCKRCKQQGALLVADEIQTGFGRTGELWGFENYKIVPDIILLGKALGGGQPLGAVVAGRELLQLFAGSPVLGHITTFGGHPVSCAAGLAAFKVLLKEKYHQKVREKERLFRVLLQHEAIREVRSNGLLLAVAFDDFDTNKKIIDACIERGVFTDWFLFAPHCMRLAPPLIITRNQVRKTVKIILQAIDSVLKK
ncbi:MAG: aspartate aminotransferase family protein [Flavihumibacter sp.]